MRSARALVTRTLVAVLIALLPSAGARAQEANHQFVRADEFRRLQGAWRAEVEKVARDLERLETDADFRYLRATKKRLGRSVYLRNIDYHVLPRGPVVYVVQRPQKDRRNYYEDIVDERYGPWLSVLNEVFQETYVEPLGLERRKGYEGATSSCSRARGTTRTTRTPTRGWGCTGRARTTILRAAWRSRTSPSHRSPAFRRT